MIRAGILYINQHCYYLNGQRIGQTFVECFNKLIYKKFYKGGVLVLFYPKCDSNAKYAAQLVDYLNGQCLLIQYRQHSPGIYIHQSWHCYIVAVIVSLSVVVIEIAGITMMVRSTISTMTPSIPKFVNQFSTVFNTINNVCDGRPCVESLLLFPNQYMVRFKSFKTNWYEPEFKACQRVKQGVYLCSKNN